MTEVHLENYHGVGETTAALLRHQGIQKPSDDAKSRLEDAKRRLALSTQTHKIFASDHVTVVGEEHVIQCREDGVRNRQHLSELRAIVREAEVDSRLVAMEKPNLHHLAATAYDAFHAALGTTRIETIFGKVEHAAPFEKLSSTLQGYWIEVARAVVEKIGL